MRPHASAERNRRNNINATARMVQGLGLALRARHARAFGSTSLRSNSEISSFNDIVRFVTLDLA
jgi:hypothetical protein